MPKDNVTYWRNYEGVAKFTTPLVPSKILNLLSSDDRILDFGCGYGRMTEYLYENGFKNLFGVDPSCNLIAKAKGSSVEKKYDIEYSVGTIDTIDQRKPFDCVMMCGVIEYFLSTEERSHLVRKISSLLNHSGKVYLETFLFDENNNELYNKARKIGMPSGTIVINDDLMVYHDTVDGINLLFNPYFKKISDNLTTFLTWKERENKGYEILFEKRI